MNNQSSVSVTPASIRATVLAGLMLGVVMGIVAGAYDVIFHAPLLEIDFAVIALMYYLAIGGGFGIVIALGSWCIQRLARWPVTMRQMIALMTGMGICFFALIVCGRKGTIMAVPTSVLIALFIARGWLRISWRTSIAWWFLLVCVASALSISRVAGVLPQSQLLLGVISLASVSVVLTLGRRACERLAVPIAVVCAVSFLALTVWSVRVFNQPLRNTPESPHHRGSGFPNVVLLVIDTLRMDYLGAYGHQGGLTPNLDRFATDSTLYEETFSTAPWTVPSHGSMFTGYYPKTHGASSEDHLWLDDALLTLPEMLQAQGFQTVSITANVTIETANFDQGFDHHRYLRRPKSNGSLMLTPLLQQLGFPSRWMDKGSAASVVELGDWFQNKYNPSKPFFLFVNVMEPHQRHQPPFKYRDAHLPPGRSHLEAVRLGASEYHGLAWHARQEDNPRRIELVRAMYAAEVAYQDERIGQMLEMLGRQVDLNETMVIITSDHGDNLGEAKRWGHLFAVNDHLLHVPLMIRYPDQFPAAKRVPGMCQLTDLVPTIFDVLDVDCPIKNLPGRSIVPTSFKPAKAVYAQWWPNHWGLRTSMGSLGRQSPLASWTAHLRVIRNQDYKYIWSSDGHHSLFDIKHDRDEAFNVIMQEPEIAKQLDERLWEWWHAQPDYQHSENSDNQPLDPQSIEMLKSIGYIGD